MSKIGDKHKIFTPLMMQKTMTHLIQEEGCCVVMCDKPLNQAYWEAQWQQKHTGWDIGYASPAICAYMDQYPNKKARILIPGCGNAYEALYLVEKGFEDITLIDIAPTAVAQLKEKFAPYEAVQVVCGDFFEQKGEQQQYDLILEQTFFCAIPPTRRSEYAQKAAELLAENGKVVGLLFDKIFEKDGPPFGGCPCEYKPIFDPHFVLKTMESCQKSIPPRKDSELFIIFNKKNNPS